MYSYITKGTCSKKIDFNIIDGKLHSVTFEKGCAGNLKAIGILVEGMDAAQAVNKLKGLCCGNKNTSCADQLVQAIEKYL